MLQGILSPTRLALVYIVKIVVGSLIVWYGLRALGVAEPVWGVISLIVVVEPDPSKATTNFRARVINTFVGCIVACITLALFHASVMSMMVAATVAVLIAMGVQNYPANWRLAPVTAVILVAAALQQTGLPEELRLVAMRAGEVMAGSAVGLLQSYVYDWGARHWPGRGEAG